MPLHPQAQQVIDAARALGLPPNHAVTPQEARANASRRIRSPGPEVAAVVNRAVPGPAGDIPVRIYTPDGAGPFPVLVWYHGGGWVVGDLESADGTARHLCVSGGCVVVSVDYRLAPEARFPEPLDDCYAATLWAGANAASLGGVNGIVAVGGDSAGGNLATAVSIKAAQSGDLRISHQLLVYPVTAADFDTGSYLDNASGYNLERDGMIWYWQQYLDDPADAVNPLAAPLQLDTDLLGVDAVANMAQALVITAEYDPLRDEGEAYAGRLDELGVPARASRYDGMIHGFFSLADTMDLAREAMDEAGAFLRGARDDLMAEYHAQHHGDAAALRKLLDPQAAKVLEIFAELGIKPFQDMTVAECRAVMNNRPRPDGPEVGKVEDRVIRNEHGKEPGDVPVRIYTPDTAGPWGTLVWFHGGGWVIGTVDTADATARELCVGGNCVVVSVDYRLAPEHKFPTPFEDCLTATLWTMHNAIPLGSSPDAIAVGGDSAGGNLAAAVALAQDDFPQPLAFQLLVYPVADYDFTTRSYQVNGSGLFLETGSMQWFWDHYLPAGELAGYNIFASPLRARLSDDLPPALVITAEFDPLRDEGEAYAAALDDAGVPTELIRYDGVIHGFFGMPHVIDKGRQALDAAGAGLAEAFGAVLDEAEVETLAAAGD